MENIVACRLCHDVLKHHKKSTSNLLHHSCVKNITSDRNKKIEISAEDKKKVLLACVEWSVTDFKSFNSVAGEGFQLYTEKILEIGKKYGSNVDVKHMLPHPTSVSNNIVSCVQKIMPKIIAEISNVTSAGITSDMWTDSFKKL